MKARFFTVTVIGSSLVAAVLSGAVALAQECPTGVACTEFTGAGRRSFFRITIPDSPAWDGDLIIINHGFDLDPLSIRPHNSCTNGLTTTCSVDSDCPAGGRCNKISYLGLDAGFLPMGKAVAASSYSLPGWAIFRTRKDIKDILKFIKKNRSIAKPARVIVTGFSLGGGVTIDATHRLKRLAGAVPMCAAAAGGLPTWDTAMDVRLIYDYLCSAVPGAAFTSAPDEGETIGEITMALRVNTCFGVLFPSSDPTEAAAQAQRLADFRSLTSFTGTDNELLVIMGFATIAIHDLTFDRAKLRGKRFGLNEGLDYSMIDPALDAGIARISAGKGRKKLAKNYTIDFTRRKAKRVNYPIVQLAANSDYLTIPEFQRVFTSAADLGNKAHTIAWVNAGGHCNFTEEEVTATYTAFFNWLDGDFVADQPTAGDIEALCLALPTGDATTCDFDLAFTPGPLSARVPARPDWFEAAKQ